MPLIKGLLASKITAFIVKQQTSVQTDPTQAINQFSQQLEDEVYAAIKSITITIPPGLPIVTSVGPATVVGPILIQGTIE